MCCAADPLIPRVEARWSRPGAGSSLYPWKFLYTIEQGPGVRVPCLVRLDGSRLLGVLLTQTTALVAHRGATASIQPSDAVIAPPLRQPH
jgi:hypothetical protein